MSSKQKSNSKAEKKRGRKNGVVFDEAFPIEFLEDNLIITKDGRVSVGFLLDLPEAETLSSDAYENLNFYLNSSLRLLPVGTAVQKLDIFYVNRYNPSKEGKGFFSRKNIDHFTDREILKHKSLLFLCFPGERLLKQTPVNTWFNLGKSLFKNPLENIDQRIYDAENLTEQFTVNMAATDKIKFTRLTDDMLWDEVYAYFNLEFSERQQTLNRAYANTYNNFSVGEKNVSCVSLLAQGEKAVTSTPNNNGIPSPMIFPLTFDLHFPHIVCQTFTVADTEKELKKLDMNRKLTGSLGRMADQSHEVKSASLEIFTAEVRAQNSRLVNLSLNLFVWDPDREVLKRKTDKTLTGMRSIFGCEGLTESFDIANLFFTLAPGNGGQAFRGIMMPAEQAACYVNWVTSRKPQKGIAVSDRDLQPIELNLWNDKLDNKNKLIIGPSGSGKSYWTNNVLVQQHEQNDDQIIIDVGGSYKNICGQLHGKYFEYNPEEPLQFNPFLIQKDDFGNLKLTTEKINFLLALIGTIWKDSALGEALTRQESVMLTKIISEYYEYLNSEEGKEKIRPGMQSFYDFIKGFEEKNREVYKDYFAFFNTKNLLLVLESFVEGEYKSVLNAEEEIDISDHQLTCFDMAGIKNDPLLYPVVSLLIIELVLDKIRRFPTKRKHVFMDEAWSMLSDSMGDFVMTMYRTIRKNNGAVTIITQGIDEISKSAVGKAIIANAATKILLDHRSVTALIPILKEELGLSEDEVLLLKSIRSGSGWKEFFIKLGDESKVYALEVSPQADAAFSSKAEDRYRIAQLTEEYGGNTEFAVNEYVREKSKNKNL